MKSVLISIQPYYVFLIIARIMGWNIPQEKTVEVRKDFPKDDAWNRRVHIYCSKNRKSFNCIPAQYQPFMAKLLGKVVGKFLCDKIDKQIVFHKVITRIMIQGYKEKLFALCKAAVLPLDELHDYIDKDGKDFEIVYGWHISDLVIYDKPKELGEFYNHCNAKYDSRKCWDCLDNGYQFIKNGFPYCKVTRPPQSWQFIEV